MHIARVGRPHRGNGYRGSGRGLGAEGLGECLGGQWEHVHDALARCIGAAIQMEVGDGLLRVAADLLQAAEGQ